MLDRLSQENFQLRDALAEICPKLLRLFERLQGTGSHRFADNVKYTDISVGGGAIMGVTVAQCSTLCAALRNQTDDLHSCNGIAYRMLDPSNAANLYTAYCFLL